MIVAIEHALFVIKIAIAVIIPDVSDKVLADEAKRGHIEEMAEEWMKEIKDAEKALTLEELVVKEKAADKAKTGPKPKGTVDVRERAMISMIKFMEEEAEHIS